MNPAAGPSLRDIHLPPPPGWWPPAPGWWLLGLAIVLCGFFVFVKLRREQKLRRTRKALLAELDRCIDAAKGDPVALAAALSQFLRRMALRDKPAAAALPDERWLQYLDSRLAGDEFACGVGRVLLDAPFRASQVYDAAALIALVRRWTRTALDTESGHA
ncbi:MAG: DUF4381 domain-containing protein [Rudaea sp.]|nr:DUF4381 domain-containing protein [Rudaea sp.]